MKFIKLNIHLNCKISKDKHCSMLSNKSVPTRTIISANMCPETFSPQFRDEKVSTHSIKKLIFSPYFCVHLSWKFAATKNILS